MIDLIQTKTPVIALIGNPNAGKTTVFNALCGMRQKTANYPGATIDIKEGRFKIENTTIKVLDLPGLYSLQATSIDEHIALDIILGHKKQYDKPDLLVSIVDVSNLKRNLFLYSQLMDTGLPILLVLTMSDLMTRRGATLDLALLEKELGISIVMVSSKNDKDMAKLKTAISAALTKPGFPKSQVEIPPGLNQAIIKLQKEFKGEGLDVFSALSLLSGESVRGYSPEMYNRVDQYIIELRDKHDIRPVVMSSRRYRWIDKIVDKVMYEPVKKTSLTKKLDGVLTHRIFGLIIFSVLMFGVFQSIYTGAGPAMDGIDGFFGWLSELVASGFVAYPVLQSLLSDGIIAGVGSVLIFIPQILLLFLFIAILEDSGYMARAAFLMDRLLGWTGLNGRAFIPMLSSFACAVPAVMAARVMPDARARLTTVLVAPLMSCSARLPVYILLIGALIEPRYGAVWAALCLFFFHLLGLLIALPVAYILNKGVLKTPGIPFLLEMPAYRVPDLRSVLIRVFGAGKKFVLQAGTIIFAMSVIIWAMSYFPRPDQLAVDIHADYASEFEQLKDDATQTTALQQKVDNQIAGTYLKQSYLGRLGSFFQPVFAPLGFNWKITVGIIGAFPAREVIISTLGIIYNVGDVDEESDSLRQSIIKDTYPDGRPVFTPLVAISLMVFFALCSQCMSTLATVYRELKSWKWTVFLFSYMTTLAYVLSLMVYQGGLLLGFG